MGPVCIRSGVASRNLELVSIWFQDKTVFAVVFLTRLPQRIHSRGVVVKQQKQFAITPAPAVSRPPRLILLLLDKPKMP